MLKEIPDHSAHAPFLTTTQGRPVPLTGIHADVAITELLMETKLKQSFVNVEDAAIEAVYTFAVPVDAVLLGLNLRIGDQDLLGKVLDAEKAQESYEDVLLEGDGAGLLEQAAEGLMTLSVGNLLPGQTAQIQLRFGQLLRFTEDIVRVHLPLTIAPRYGSPSLAGIQPHQEPVYDMDNGAGFSLALAVEGILATGTLDCPSHLLALKKDATTMMGALRQEQVPLDRDLVLVFTPHSASASFALRAQDTDGEAILLGLRPTSPEGVAPAPVNLKILVDCSGSMTGDSMEQARKGLRRVLQSLRPEDSFSLTTFGSHFQHHHKAMVPATEQNISLALSLLDRMDADMGGTELGNALHAVYAIAVNQRKETGMTPGRREEAFAGPYADVLLITDGEVDEGSALLRQAEASGHRVFTVGVGSSVCEPVVRGLADVSRGFCELVSPNENMASAIHRQFQRMTVPQARVTGLRWPTAQGTSPSINPRLLVPKSPCLFAGDTTYQAAFMDAPNVLDGQIAVDLDWGGVSQKIEVEVKGKSANSHKMHVEPEALPTVTRMAAAMALKETTDAEQAKALALRYQLVSKHTSYLVVFAHAEKNQQLPVLRTVPQTLAAGWGGMGSVLGSLRAADMCFCMPSPCDLPESPRSRKALYTMREDALWHPRTDGGAMDEEMDLPSSFWRGLALRVEEFGSTGSVDLLTLDDLSRIGLDDEYTDHLRNLIADTISESMIVSVFLDTLKKLSEGASLSRNAKRYISWHGKQHKPGRKLCKQVVDICAGMPF